MNNIPPNERFTLHETRSPTRRDVHDTFDCVRAQTQKVYNLFQENNLEITREEWHLSEDVSDSWISHHFVGDTNESEKHLRYKLLGAEYLDLHGHKPLTADSYDVNNRRVHEPPEDTHYTCFEITAPYGRADVRSDSIAVEAGNFQPHRLLYGLWGDDTKDMEPLDTIVVFPYSIAQTRQRLIAYRYELAE